MKKNYGKYALIVLPIVAALMVLYPTYRAGNLEKLESEAISKAQAAETRADSISIMQAFYDENGEALQKAKDSKLKMGLDLRGGMYVTLEVDVVKLLEESAQKESVDDIFEQVIQATRDEVAVSEEPTLDIFMRHFDKIARPANRSLISYFDIGEISDPSEERIFEKLSNDADEAIKQAQEVIRQRIDKYGVSEPNIQQQGNRRIVLELPGVTDETQMRNLLQTTARLEFKLLRNNQDIVAAFRKIDQVLENQYKRKKGIAADEPVAVDSVATEQTAESAETSDVVENSEATAESATSIENGDTTATAENTDTTDAPKNFDDMSPEEQDKLKKEYEVAHQFTRLFATFFAPGKNQKTQFVDYTMDNFPKGEYLFRIHKDSLVKFEEILSRPEIAALIPADLEVIAAAKPERVPGEAKPSKIFDMYCVKKEAELMGDVITNAMKNIDPTNNQWVVNMSMNNDGAEKWSKVTGANIGKRIAIVLDGRVYSAPNVQAKISGGNSQISGMANAEEANLLEIVLKAGALKAPVRIIEERVIGASLGEDSIAKGLNASMIAALLVIIFMVVYYNKAGLVANYAVIMNVILVIGALASLGGTLTLPGIAGIILTIGMAVDANVLIYERVREELAKGRTLRAAVDEGYSKALSAILDSNITTFFTGMILFYFGTGLIQGFALTLMVGILATLFTAIVVTKAIIELSIMSGATSYNFGQPKSV